MFTNKYRGCSDDKNYSNQNMQCALVHNINIGRNKVTTNSTKTQQSNKNTI